MLTSRPLPAPGAVLQDGTKPLTSDWNVGGHHLEGLADPVNPTDAATKEYADGASAGAGVILADGSVPMANNWSMGGFAIRNVANVQGQSGHALNFTCVGADPMYWYSNGTMHLQLSPLGAVVIGDFTDLIGSLPDPGAGNLMLRQNHSFVALAPDNATQRNIVSYLSSDKSEFGDAAVDTLVTGLALRTLTNIFATGDEFHFNSNGTLVNIGGVKPFVFGNNVYVIGQKVSGAPSIMMQLTSGDVFDVGDGGTTTKIYGSTIGLHISGGTDALAISNSNVISLNGQTTVNAAITMTTGIPILGAAEITLKAGAGSFIVNKINNTEIGRWNASGLRISTGLKVFGEAELTYDVTGGQAHTFEVNGAEIHHTDVDGIHVATGKAVSGTVELSLNAATGSYGAFQINAVEIGRWNAGGFVHAAGKTYSSATGTDTVLNAPSGQAIAFKLDGSQVGSFNGLGLNVNAITSSNTFPLTLNGTTGEYVDITVNSVSKIRADDNTTVYSGGQSVKGTVPGGYPYATLPSDGKVLVDCSGGIVTVLLADGTTELDQWIVDAKDSSLANPITVGVANVAKKLNGTVNGTFTINQKGATRLFTRTTDGNWHGG